MCAVSNIGDMGRTMWPEPWQPAPQPKPFVPYGPGGIPTSWPPNPLATPPYNGPTKEQFEEFLKMMRSAKKLDTLLGLKDCEMAEKLKWLKTIAKHLGIDVKDLVT